MNRYSKCCITSTAFFLCTVFCIPQSFAADPAKRQAHSTDYLREMPSAERVMGDFRGEGFLNTNLDTAKRQIAALSRLITMIALQQEGGEYLGKPTAEEQALRRSYSEATDSIISKISNETFGEGKQRQLNAYRGDQGLEGDKTIEKELLERYFSPAWQTKYLGITTTLAQERAMNHAKAVRANEVTTAKLRDNLRETNPSVNLSLLFIGVIVSVVGFSGLLWCGKRAFYRTNQFGVQEFKSFSNLFFVQGFENFVGMVSMVMVFGGVGSIVFSFFDVALKAFNR